MGSIILLIVLILLNAVFASAEMAVISMNAAKLKKLTADGNKHAGKLTALTAQPARFLATIQVAITLAGLLSSAFAAENFAGPLAAAMVRAGAAIPEQILKTGAVFVITLVLAYFNLVFGELVPKRIAMKKAEPMALGMAGMLLGVSKVFAPLVFLLTASTNFILRLIGMNPEENENQVSEEEIRMLLMEGNEQGTIRTDESEMIQNIFEFDDISVGQICTHRIDVAALDSTESFEEWEAIIHSTRHTFYPVFGKGPDDIIGVLDTKDYFRSQNKERTYIMETAVDHAYYIPESMKANVLFQNMRKSRIYFAVIIDEYGGLSGIVTLHDLMEALVGDIYETEEEIEPKEIEKTGDNSWSIHGYAALDDVSEELRIPLPTDKYDTFGGFICGAAGRIPSDGESLECESHGMNITVHTVLNHRIGSTTVRLSAGI